MSHSSWAYAEEEKMKTPSVLFLSGSPYECGYTHGKSLKEAVAYNVNRIVDKQILAKPEHPFIKSFLTMLPEVIHYLPKDYIEEMRGLAEGSELPYEKILLLNLFPEMFHCTGLTLKGKATKEGELYHVRVLDYNMGQGLQDTHVLLVVRPDGKIPFLNVSYAGFIGCVTGMNVQKLALGEIGGKGQGNYLGMPMAFLLRMILEQASNLEDVKNLLSQEKRTCEYYYLFSDGKNKDSLGVYATPQQLQWVYPGLSFALFENEMEQNCDDKVVLTSNHIQSSPYQIALYQDEKKEKLWGLILHQPDDCLAVTGFSHPERYPILLERLSKNYGKIDLPILQEMIKQPVAREGNLHNAIFAPAQLNVWISHAGTSGEAACDQPYNFYNLQDLLDSKSPVNAL